MCSEWGKWSVRGRASALHVSADYLPQAGRDAEAVPLFEVLGGLTGHPYSPPLSPILPTTLTRYHHHTHYHSHPYSLPNPQAALRIEPLYHYAYLHLARLALGSGDA